MATWKHAHSSATSHVITTKLCRLDYVRETNIFAKFGWNPPARVAPRIREIYTSLWHLPAFFSCAPCTGQTDRDNLTHNGSKDAVWRKKVPSQQVFFSHLTFWGSFCANPLNFAPVGKSQPNKQSRLTSKPFKINKKCQLDINIKSGSPFFPNP